MSFYKKNSIFGNNRDPWSSRLGQIPNFYRKSEKLIKLFGKTFTTVLFFVQIFLHVFFFCKTCSDTYAVQVGVFPSNFVEMCEDEATDPIKARAETIEELPLSTKV